MDVDQTIQEWERLRDTYNWKQYNTLTDILIKEVKRLRAGGCARDQKSTQYCAEAAAKENQLTAALEEIAKLKLEISKLNAGLTKGKQ